MHDVEKLLAEAGLAVYIFETDAAADMLQYFMLGHSAESILNSIR